MLDEYRTDSSSRSTPRPLAKEHPSSSVFGLPTRVWVEFFDEFSLPVAGRLLTLTQTRLVLLFVWACFVNSTAIGPGAGGGLPAYGCRGVCPRSATYAYDLAATPRTTHHGHALQPACPHNNNRRRRRCLSRPTPYTTRVCRAAVATLPGACTHRLRVTGRTGEKATWKKKTACLQSAQSGSSTTSPTTIHRQPLPA